MSFGTFGVLPLLPAPHVAPVIQHEPVHCAQVCRTGDHTVWIDGSGRHSSDPHHRRCGVGCYTDTQERAWLPLRGIRQLAYRAEFLAGVRALEELIDKLSSVIATVWSGRYKPFRASVGIPKAEGLPETGTLRNGRMKAHQTQAAVDLGTESAGLSDATWTNWATIAHK
eukprot:4300169-Amphidinium_carterae.2